MRKTFHTTRETISSHVCRNMAEYLTRSNARKHAAKIELKFCNTKRRVEDEDDDEINHSLNNQFLVLTKVGKALEKANIMTVNSHAIASAESSLGKIFFLHPNWCHFIRKTSLENTSTKKLFQQIKETRQRTEM